MNFFILFQLFFKCLFLEVMYHSDTPFDPGLPNNVGPSLNLSLTRDGSLSHTACLNMRKVFHPVIWISGGFINPLIFYHAHEFFSYFILFLLFLIFLNISVACEPQLTEASLCTIIISATPFIQLTSTFCISSTVLSFSSDSLLCKCLTRTTEKFWTFCHCTFFLFFQMFLCRFFMLQFII